MPKSDPSDPQSVADAAMVEQLMGALDAQFGDRLDDAARVHIRRQFSRMVGQSRALASYPLPAATEPALMFDPYRAG